MLKLNTILAPVDFSGRSLATAEHAVHMANRFGANLVLAYVKVPVPAYYGGYVPSAQQELDAYSRDEITKLVERITVGKPIETIIVEGDPAQRIEQLIQERNVDLVMMATHGYGTFRKFIVGSVTAKVLHDARCPVFTGAHVPEVAKFNTEPYKRVACAIDLKEHSETVLRWASEFAAAWEADLIVVHAAPTLGSDGIYTGFFPADARDMLVGHAQIEIEKLCKKMGVKP
jgi:nucleotide-binding universal stress UspA family protein